MNGWITIGSKLDTKQLDKDIKDAEKELSRYEKEGEKLATVKTQKKEDLSGYYKEIELIKERVQAIQDSNQTESQRQFSLQMEQTALDQLNEKYKEQLSAYENISKKVAENKNKQEEVKQEVEDLNDKLKNVQAYDTIKGKIQEMGNELKNVAKKGDIKGITNRVQGISSSIKGITGKIAKWGMALFGIRTAYNFIRQSANTVFQQNEGLANQVNLMKNAIASALEPLIRRLVSLVYTLFSFVNSIVAKLTGKNLFAQAQKNLAKGAGSAKEINKQLAGFDEMNVLSDSSGGGGGGGFDTTGFVEENAKLAALLEKLRKLAEEGDWGGIARTISEGIISGLNGITERIKSIDWSGIGAAISEFLTNIDFSGIFVSFTTMIGEAFLGIQDLILSIDWGTVFKNLSQALADTFAKVGEYIQQIRWEDIGKLITDVFTNIKWGDMASNMIQALWNALQGIVDLFLAIDWSLVGQTISNAVHQWISSIITLFQETDWVQLGEDITNAIFDFIESVDWLQLGMDIITGLGEGCLALIDFFVGVFATLIEKILDFLGIHSPSTLFADIGQNLIEGLVNGIESLLNTVVDTFKGLYNSIKEVFLNMLNWIKNSIITPLANFFSNLWTGIKNGVQNAYDKIKSIFQGVIDFFKGIISKVVSTFGTLGSKVGDTISGAFKNVVNKVLSGVEKILNSPIKAINGLINTINAIPGINIGKLSTFSLPRLAKGGIINQPGRGVMVGSAIGGERGREGVIPLTDSQQMAMLGEAIGRYVTINATIPVYAYNRQVDRQVKRIKAEDDFAFNR